MSEAREYHPPAALQTLRADCVCDEVIPPVGVIILAAGASTRMGTPKQLLEFHGRSLLRHAAETAIASGLGPIVVVLGAYADSLGAELTGLHARCVTNPNWRKGIGTSIRCGVQELRGCVEAIVIMPCDQALVDPHVISAIVTAYRTSGLPVVACEYEGVRGVPALFSQTYFDELGSLPDDAGAKRIIERAGAMVHGVPFLGGALDIDTPMDYERLQDSCGPLRKIGSAAAWRPA